MSGYSKPSDPLDQMSQAIAELQGKVRELSAPQSFRLPILAADPPVTDPINIWLLPDGRLRARHRNTADTAWVIREWVATAAGSTSSGTAPAPPPPAPVTRQDSWTAQWSQSYRQSGAARTDLGVTHLYYGSSGDGFNGRNRSLIGFDYAAIASALSGSTVLSVSLRLINIHSWYNNGSDIHMGVHNFTSEPATWAGGGIPRSMVAKYHYGKPEDKTVSLPLYFATDIRDGVGKGIAFESPSDSRTFYGYAAGVGSGYIAPTLTVQYAK